MNLRTVYMGLELEHPLVASASPISASVGGIKRLEDAGAAAVVMPSLFEEQILHENAALDWLSSIGANSFSEASGFFSEWATSSRVGPERYLETLHRATRAVDIPVIASLNGYTNEGWSNIAAQMEEAGAAGIELNIFYIPADLRLSGPDVERQYLEIVAAVKSSVSIPVAVKLSPFFSSFGHMAKQLDDAGADALVLFNRFYQPDFNLQRLEVEPNLELSGAHEIRLPLLWIAVLYHRVSASLAATRGVESSVEVVKYLLAGADVVMTTSALLRNGAEYIEELRRGLERWLDERNYRSLEQMRGSMSQQHVSSPTAFERANYIKVLESYKGQAAPTDYPLPKQSPP